MNYLYEYDNPYTVLAHSIVGSYRPADVIRILTDDEYLLTLIIKETREQDVCGQFLDCIIEGILEDKRRMEYMHVLDQVARYYYGNLDKERLRSEILKALSEANITIDVVSYSTGGSDSSAKTYESPVRSRNTP